VLFYILGGNSSYFLASILAYSPYTSVFDLACISLAKWLILLTLITVSENQVLVRLEQRLPPSRWPTNWLILLVTLSTLTASVAKGILILVSWHHGQVLTIDHIGFATLGVSVILGLLELVLVEPAYRRLEKTARKVIIDSQGEILKEDGTQRKWHGVMRLLAVGKPVSDIIMSHPKAWLVSR